MSKNHCEPTTAAVLLLFVLINLMLTAQTRATCDWTVDNSSTTATAGTKNSLKCDVRTLERSGLDITSSQLENTSKLRIKCNEMLLFESTISSDVFSKLQSLDELYIDSCKLLKIPENVFETQAQLKKLTVNTHNAQWGVGKSLEFAQNTFKGLGELQTLDLSSNNIRLIPDMTLCPLKSLQMLNLTQNRIKNTENLGFHSFKSVLNADMKCHGCEELLILDISNNELRTIPENWAISKLRRLQQLLLQNNNITDLSSESLIGLTSLRVLNLSGNQLESLPNGLFAGSRELREIHLQQNELFELPKGLFHRLEQLLVLDLSLNQLSSHHIDENTFLGLIRLIVLNLSHNALTRIDSKTFKDLFFLQILDLRNNSIGFIDENAFLPLYNLHTLNLAENRLHILDDKIFNGLYVLSKLTLNNNLITSIDKNCFKNCSDLKELDLSSNQLSEIPEAIHVLSMLKSLDLGENQISTFRNGSFKNLAQLTGLRLIDNQISNLSKGMFWDLPNLQVLNLAKNKIETIERGIFENNPQLEAIRLDKNFLQDVDGIFASLISLLWLNLSENHLVWFDYAFIPANLKWLDIHSNYIEVLGNYYKIQEKIKLKTLDASHNRLSDIASINIPNSIELLFINNNFIKNIHVNTFVDKIYLTRVDLYANEMNYLPLNSLRLAPLRVNQSKIPEFYIGGNIFNCDCHMEWLQRINNLSLTKQYPKIMDLANVQCRLENARRKNEIVALSKLKSSDFLCKYETHCFALCHCCEFDACDCEMICPKNCSCYHDETWSTNIVDCGHKLTRGNTTIKSVTDNGGGNNMQNLPIKLPMDSSEVYLDGRRIKILENHAFIGRKNLRKLYVNDSSIEVIQNRTFNGLITLEILHLNDNLLKNLHGYEFGENLANLRELFLQNNLIAVVMNGTFKYLINLQILRLDGNKLHTMDFAQINSRSIQSVQLSDNPWSCKCKTLRKLSDFIIANSAKIPDLAQISCTEYSKRQILDMNYTICTDLMSNSAFLYMNQYLYVLITVLFVILMLIMGVVACYLQRKNLAVWLYAKYDIRLLNGIVLNDNASYTHDGLLLYSPKDADFAQKHIANDLEYGPEKYKLCLLHRDITSVDLEEIGESEQVNLQILDKSRTAKRVLILLTSNFLQTEWTKCSIKQTVHENSDRLIIIQNLDTEIKDTEMKLYIKTAKNRIRIEDKRFLAKLRYSMPDLKRLNRDITKFSNKNTYTSEKNQQMRQNYPPIYVDDQNLDLSHPQQNYEYKFRQNNRPPSEHIYSSIDSDYSTLERNDVNFKQFGQDPSGFGQRSTTGASGCIGGTMRDLHGINTTNTHQQQNYARSYCGNTLMVQHSGGTGGNITGSGLNHHSGGTGGGTISGGCGQHVQAYQV